MASTIPDPKPDPPPPPPRPPPWYPPERESRSGRRQYHDDDEYEDDFDDSEDMDYERGRRHSNQRQQPRPRHSELPDVDIYGIPRGHPMYRPYLRYTGPLGKDMTKVLCKVAARLEAKHARKVKGKDKGKGKSDQEEPTEEKKERSPSPLPLPPWMRQRPAESARRIWEYFYGEAAPASTPPKHASQPPEPVDEGQAPNPSDLAPASREQEDSWDNSDLFALYFSKGRDSTPERREKKRSR